MGYIVLVSGDRNWKDEDFIFEQLDDFHYQFEIDQLVEGCARGADSIAEKWAKSRDVPNRHFPADWDRLGKSAGPKRNIQMLEKGTPDIVMAFHYDLQKSKGTKHMVEIARKEGVHVVTYP